MKQAIRVEEVSKTQQGVKYIASMNLSVNEGDVVGIMANDNETINIFMQLLSGELMPCEGEIYYGEERLGLYGQTPENVGVYINEIGFIKEFTGYKNLKYIAGMNERATKDDIIETMNFVGLNPESRLRVKQYSKRMQQKMGIAQAIMEGQDLLLLHADLFSEENLENHMELRKIVRKLKKCGLTIILTSEKEEYVSQLCDRIITLN